MLIWKFSIKEKDNEKNTFYPIHSIMPLGRVV